VKEKSARARLFVALPLPVAVTGALAAIQPRAEDGVRLIPPADMHLTLHFLGAADIEAVSRALAVVHMPAFTLRLNEPGHFSPRGRKTILWCGVLPSNELQALHRATAEALEAAGFATEKRPYQAHVTVARLDASLPRTLVDTFEAGLPGPDPPEFECTRFALYESETHATGARYRILESYSLPARA
jgi:2'-5' RNA ligase